MRAAASGIVIVSFIVAEDGSVNTIRVIQENVPGFGEAARNAVAQWTFIPSVLQKNRSKATFAHMRCKLEFHSTEGN
jgi:TonB family protein